MYPKFLDGYSFVPLSQTLTISNVDHSHAGNYKCVAKNGNKERTSQVAYLDVSNGKIWAQKSIPFHFQAIREQSPSHWSPVDRSSARRIPSSSNVWLTVIPNRESDGSMRRPRSTKMASISNASAPTKHPFWFNMQALKMREFTPVAQRMVTIV